MNTKRAGDETECTVVRFSGHHSDPRPHHSAGVRIESLKGAPSGSTVVPASSAPDDGGCCPPQFGVFYAVCVTLSIVTYVADLGFVVALLYYYSAYSEGAHFAVTLTFVLVPALFMTAFNLRWYIVDHDDPTLGKTSTCQWIIRLLFLVLQVSPILRYTDTLYYGLKSVAAKASGLPTVQATYYRRMLDEDTNGALLRLFHCFLQSGPQSVIQLMLLLRGVLNDKDGNEDLMYVQKCTVAVGIVSIAWSLTTYHRSVRQARDDKEKMRWEATMVAFCWHLTSAVSRVLALAMLASIYTSWMIVVCVLHWGIMALWLAFEHLTASCTNRCEEFMLSVALGLAYVLAFISPRDGPTRYVYLVYYLVCFMENTGALVVWCVTNNSADNLLLYYGTVSTQVTTFLLTLVFLSIYYRCFHPTKASGKAVFACPGKSGLSKSYNLRSYS